jgi:hypothetical protein
VIVMGIELFWHRQLGIAGARLEKAGRGGSLVGQKAVAMPVCPSCIVRDITL